MNVKFDDSELKVRRAREDDMVAVAQMIQDLADFEKMPDAPKLTAKDLQLDGFKSEPPAFRCLIAEILKENNSVIVGYALYFSTYSTWEGRSMMLKDLYVQAGVRRRGVGRKLFNAVAKEAKSAGSSRLDFHVLEWNDARAFYEAKGAVNLTKSEQWCFYRLVGEALEAVALSREIK